MLAASALGRATRLAGRIPGSAAPLSGYLLPVQAAVRQWVKYGRKIGTLDWTVSSPVASGKSPPDAHGCEHWAAPPGPPIFVASVSIAHVRGNAGSCGSYGRMEDGETYDEPSDVSAKGGGVKLDGPDAVDVTMTPEAAEETAERMVDQAVMARGQRIMKQIKVTKK